MINMPKKQYKLPRSSPDIAIIYKQISKTNQLLFQRIYQTKTQWLVSQNIIPLTQYIKEQQKYQFNYLQLKIQKLLMSLRQLAYAFIVRGINIMNTINIENIGIHQKFTKQQTTNNNKVRYSMAPTYGYQQKIDIQSQISNNKLVQQPIFKLYIDFSILQAIMGEQNIGRMIIESQKFIIGDFRRKLDELIQTISQDQIRNFCYNQRKRGKQVRGKCHSVTQPQPHKYTIPKIQNNKQAWKQLEFAKKLKKKNKPTKNNYQQQYSVKVFKIQKNITPNQKNISKYPTLNFKNNNSIKKLKYTDNTTKTNQSSINKTQQLTKRVQDIVLKSRTGLNKFRDKFLNTSHYNYIIQKQLN